MDDKEFIDILKTEVNIVFNQMHTRMKYKQTLINILITFTVAILTFLIKNADQLTDNVFFLILSLFFPAISLIFGFIILREDFLLVSHDKYLYKIRKEIINKSLKDNYNKDMIFGFSSSMYEVKNSNSYAWLLNGLTPIVVFLSSFMLLSYTLFLIGTQNLKALELLKLPIIFIIIVLYLIACISYYKQLNELKENHDEVVEINKQLHS